MGFFTPRERAALGKSAELREQREQGKVRELVRHDFTPRPRPPYPERPNHHERPASTDRMAGPDRMPSPERAPSHDRLANPDLAGHVGTLMQRVSDTSVHEIDDLIAVLQRRREALLSESARMQREIIEYAKLNQATLQSTKIITESLASFRRVSDAPSLSEPHAETFAEPRADAISEALERELTAEAASQEAAPAREDAGMPEAQVEAPELAADTEKEPT
jgi:hypothetical protein